MTKSCSMFTEDDLLPISALQHLAFCERQWALIHLEQSWAENVLTAEGRLLHDRAHDDEIESRGHIRIARGMRIRSLRLGLVGMMDVVEFEKVKGQFDDSGKTIAGRLRSKSGWWRPVPVEYKRGSPKAGNCDRVQLCAQAISLEEMLKISIPAGVLFYGRPRRRTEVTFNIALREETDTLAARLHEMSNLGKTPSPEYSKRCLSCSLIDICKPKCACSSKASSRYIARVLREINSVSLQNEKGDK